METVLITGGAGFIGSHLAERLLKGCHVIVLDNFDPYYDPEIKRKNISFLTSKNNKNFHFFEADIRNKNYVEKIIKEKGINKIVHLAAKVGVRSSIKNPLEYIDVNICGTLNLLELARKYDIKNFVFGSSSSVYGISNKIPFLESDPADKPISPYAASKQSCELFCHTYNYLYKIPICCLRFFTVYGPRQRPDMAISKFTKSIEEDREIQVFGDGSSKRDYTYVTDIIDGIASTLNKKFDFEIINLGDSNTVELRYLISLIEKELKKKAKIKQMPEQPGDVPITCASIAKAEKLLDYKPSVPIEEGIKKFVEWFRMRK